MRLSRKGMEIGISIVPGGTGISESSRRYLERTSELAAYLAVSRTSIRS